MTQEDYPENWQGIYESLPPFVTRKMIAHIAGFISAHTLANFDAQGTGISGKRIIGCRAVYPKHEVIRWLIDYANKNVTK